MNDSDSVCEVDEFGNRRWFLGGVLHRVDGPAIERANGDKCWFLGGKRHRVDGPAIERANGDREWYVNGKLHRVDGPAVERSDGYRAWFLDDERFPGPGFLLDVGVGVKEIREFEGWPLGFPGVLVVDGFEFGSDYV